MSGPAEEDFYKDPPREPFTWKSRRLWGAVGMSAIIALYVAVYIITGQPDTWNYRMTVVMETPEGLKSGYAVRKVKRYEGISLLPEQGPDHEVEGEAIAVDLGSQGVVFALMRGAYLDIDYSWGIMYSAYPKFWRFPKNISKEPIILKPDQYPMFVRFSDRIDPKGLEDLTRREETGHYKWSYYFQDEKFKGVRIKEISIQITDEPVTHELEKWLPWLENRKIAKFADLYDTATKSNLYLKDFIRGDGIKGVGVN